jgi:hypothetical protein
MRGVPSRRLHVDVQQPQGAQRQHCTHCDVRELDGSTERLRLPRYPRGRGPIGITVIDNRHRNSGRLMNSRGLLHFPRQGISRWGPCPFDVRHAPKGTSHNR